MYSVLSSTVTEIGRLRQAIVVETTPVEDDLAL